MELFKLMGKIAIDNTEANKALNETSEAGGKAESKLSKMFGGIGSAAAKLGTVAVAGLGATATAIGVVAKKSLDAYADYEQLVGGVETLFGAGGKGLSEYAKSVGKTVEEAQAEYQELMQGQNIVLRNADEAYKTAGMSANEYMETVTGFSASLIQSLNGDTAKAADKANQAIVDMSDNANKMGSDMTSIQNAYQGFAKQNYTMLDNLKLGYGGTKEEMQRLLEDATKLSGIEYDISSYADVVDAIHVIQTEMGITGTTAKEASETISGSASAMKASWQNLVTGFGNEEANLEELIGQFTDSVVTYGKNLVPRIGIILKSIGTVIVTEVPKILKKIPSMVVEILPDLQNSFSEVFSNAFGNAFSDDFKSTLSWFTETAFPNLLGHFKDSAIDNFADKLSGVKDLLSNLQKVLQPLVEVVIGNLLVGITDLMAFTNDVVLPVLGTITGVFLDIGNSILTNIQPAITTISEKFSELQGIVSEAINDYIIPVIQDFISMIQELLAENQDKINAIGELFGTVFNAIANIVSWFVGVVEEYLYPMFIWLVGIVQENMENIKAVFQSAFDIIGGIVQFFIALFKGDWQGMWDAVKSILQAGYDFVVNIFNLIKSFLSSIGNAIWSVVQAAFEKVRIAIFNKITLAKNAVTSVFNNIKETISEKLELAKKKVTDIFDNIKKTISDKIDAAKMAVHDAIEKIKGYFNFEWKLPDLKLPHFNIDGEFSLNPPSVPKFDIEWYKNGAILTEPTAFGINPETGKVMAGGEAGKEAVAPLDTLMGYVRTAVSEQTGGLYELMSRLVELIEDYMPELIIASNKKIVLNNGVLVGELAPAIDREIGGISSWKERGNR